MAGFAVQTSQLHGLCRLVRADVLSLPFPSADLAWRGWSVASDWYTG
jgi:hypothetical protein